MNLQQFYTLHYLILLSLYTCSILNNFVQFFQIQQEWLDYVMFLSDYEEPTSSSFDILDSKTTSAMRMCWDLNKVDVGVYRFPDSPECHETKQFRDLSDHFPVVADFTFP